jgi:hypothetical protein
MAVRTKIESISSDIKLIVTDLLSPAAQSKAIAEFARGEITAADETNRSILGRVPPRVITVDGTAGAALDSVNPRGGNITVEWEIVTDVLIWIGKTLRDRSPVGPTGNFRDGWTLLVDGVEVAIGEQVPPGEVFTFVNREPYSRKIEVGKTESGRDFVVQVPNRIAERTAKDAASRFGNIAKIRSVWISLQGAYTLKHNQATRSFAGGKMTISKRQRPDRVAGKAITYPAVAVTLRNL